MLKARHRARSLPGSPLLAGLAPLAAIADLAVPPRPVVVGAIRWDGWYAGNPWERNLDEPEWRPRLPFTARETPDGRV